MKVSVLLTKLINNKKVVKMEKDPVCGMEVTDASNDETYEYKGKIYYFCTTLCKIQFENDPEKYVKDDKDKEDHTHNHH